MVSLWKPSFVILFIHYISLTKVSQYLSWIDYKVGIGTYVRSLLKFVFLGWGLKFVNLWIIFHLDRKETFNPRNTWLQKLPYKRYFYALWQVQRKYFSFPLVRLNCCLACDIIYLNMLTRGEAAYFVICKIYKETQ